MAEHAADRKRAFSYRASERVHDDASCQLASKVFLVCALVFGALAAVLTPAGSGYDEPYHIARVDQLASGKMFAEVVGANATYKGSDIREAPQDALLYGGDTDKVLFDVAYRGLRVQANRHVYTFPAWNDEYSQARLSYGAEGKATHVFSNSAINSPVVYIPHILGFFLARAVGLSAYWIVVSMRIAGLIFYALVLYWCIRIIPFGKWILAVVAASVGALSEFAMVSPDTVTMAASFSLVSVSLNMACSENKIAAAKWWQLAASVAVLAFAKMAYYPMVLFLLCVPLISPALRKRRTIGYLFGITCFGLALFLLWFNQIHAINSGAMWRLSNNPAYQVHYIISHPLRFLHSVGFLFPSYDIWGTQGLGFYSATFPKDLKAAADIGWIGALLLALALFAHDRSERIPHNMPSWLPGFAALVFGVFLCCTLLVFLALYIGFSPAGSLNVKGVQPRYFIPLAILPGLVVSVLTLGASRGGATIQLPCGLKNLYVLARYCLWLVAAYLLYGFCTWGYISARYAPHWRLSYCRANGSCMDESAVVR